MHIDPLMESFQSVYVCVGGGGGGGELGPVSAALGGPATLHPPLKTVGTNCV